MVALVEVHSDAQLDLALASGARIIGVNNRDLRTLEVTLDTFAGLAHRVPGDRILVSESGIASAEDVRFVAGAGADAVLVGSALVADSESGGLLPSLTGVPSVSRSRRRPIARSSTNRLEATPTGWGLP